MKLHLLKKRHRGALGAFLLVLCFPILGLSQSLTLSLPEVMVADGATVSLPLTVADFDSIVSLQL